MGTASQPTGRHNEGKRALLDDDYMMTTYKVIPCSRVSTHNWKLCHFSHVGETAARRRHPSCHQADLCTYVSANKECPDGDKCPYAHNAFESWLHPDRYKTTLCSYAGACTRKFCFFAHSPHELRHPIKQHPAAAANPQLRLAKTASLDTSPSACS
ncbi:hypothetical protein OEZ86_006895 [Tetradesmus obliquus]|nr:hypothetical protein OEZ86_006895 [Tetradesmus obliquus]